MTETQLLTAVAALVAAMFGLLCTIIGWIGNRAINKLDDLAKVIELNKDELHDRISKNEAKFAEHFSEHERRISSQFVSHDRRITKIEARCEMIHKPAQD